ncbi:fumarylacetoacetate hydrolase family protein [Tundrisphaera sp. TA3]|uniref:fumarylacetoacetate hydrolase family protein n=1 Tax=Tundrisphaera sp. TA3 TaxID=3435775 RepID=UPI003EBA3219
MQLARFATATDPTPRVGLIEADGIRPIGPDGSLLSDLLHLEDPSPVLAAWLEGATMSPLDLASVQLLAPIDAQEVWGAGVTYERSKTAREEESERAATFYDLVYRADRPELFFKATPSRVVGPGQPIRVRQDSAWCVPEPELALIISPSLRIVGYTVGNDVSARDIEGVNPLYLPQAKMYDGCCALGPVVTLAGAMPRADDAAIRLEIERDGQIVVEGSTSTAKMARRFEDLIAWLGRDNRFPGGLILLTGTGIIPPDDFTLKQGDLVRITIDGIGTLVNPVVQGPIA